MKRKIRHNVRRNPSIGRRVLQWIPFCIAMLTPICAWAQQWERTTGSGAIGYVLGPDDEIVIRVLDGYDISDKPILIGTNGNVTLPLIGRVEAGGLTVEQLEAKLVSLLKQYIQNPQVSVTVAEFRSQPVSVLGAVTTPGVIHLRGRKTLYEVLSLAGGPRETAGFSVILTRRQENGAIPLPDATLDPDGRFSSAEFSLQEIMQGKIPAGNIEIMPHDVIAVSQANSRMVYVVGDVQRPGAFTLGTHRSISVLSALSLAGGLGRTARPEHAKVFRDVPGQQKREVITINIKQILAGKGEDIALRSEDILVVPTNSRKAFAASFVPAAVAATIGAAIYAGVQ